MFSGNLSIELHCNSAESSLHEFSASPMACLEVPVDEAGGEGGGVLSHGR